MKIRDMSISLGIVVFFLPGAVFAVGQGSAYDSKTESQKITGTIISVPTIPTTPVLEKHINTVEVKNNGEETQIQTNERETERTEAQVGTNDAGYGNLTDERRNGFMNDASNQIQELLHIKISGEPGDQVRLIAQEQDRSQQQVQEYLMKLEARNNVVKMLFGSDYRTLRDLKMQLEQTRTRISQLEQVKLELSNQGDMQAIENAIQVFIEQNMILQERISSEEQTKSMFGWLMRYFEK